MSVAFLKNRNLISIEEKGTILSLIRAGLKLLVDLLEPLEFQVFQDLMMRPAREYHLLVLQAMPVTLVMTPNLIQLNNLLWCMSVLLHYWLYQLHQSIQTDVSPVLQANTYRKKWIVILVTVTI